MLNETQSLKKKLDAIQEIANKNEDDLVAEKPISPKEDDHNVNTTLFCLSITKKKSNERKQQVGKGRQESLLSQNPHLATLCWLC